MSEYSDPLNLALRHITDDLGKDNLSSGEFDRLVDQLKTLISVQISGQQADVQDLKEERAYELDSMKLKHEIELATLKDRVSLNTWATIGANLLGIALILNYEHLHVVSSKALGFIMKTKTH